MPQSPVSKAYEPPIPMGGLMTLLRDSGFLATTDDYVDLLKIIEQYGHEGLDSLALRICPIIAMSPEEQARFYNVFEGYKREQRRAVPDQSAEPDTKTRKTPRKRWIRLLAAALALLLCVALLWMFLRPPRIIHLSPGRRAVTIGLKEPFEGSIDPIGFLEGHPAADTAFIYAVWEETGRGMLDSGRRISHWFTQTGLHPVRRTVYSSRFSISDASDTTDVTVCGYLPHIDIAALRGAQPVKTPLRFSARPDTVSPMLKGFTWNVDGVDSDFKTEGSAPFVHQFDSPGVYTVTCRGDIPGNAAACIRTFNTEVEVVDTSQQYSLAFHGDGRLPPLKSSLKWWPGILALLLSAATLWILFKKRKKKVLPPPVQAEPPAMPVSVAPGPPYEVPFAPLQPGDILIDKPLRRFLQQLRSRAAEEVMTLDVGKSIRATIRNNGMTEAVETPRRRMQDYLLFIDQREPHGLLYALYNYLGDVMESEGLPVRRFYYDAGFRCYNADYLSGTSLRSIADNYADSVPIILGDGKPLLHRTAPAFLPGLLSELKRWAHCLLLTPVPAGSWKRDEAVLKKHLTLAPLDADALQELGQQLRSGAARRPAAAGAQQAASFTPPALSSMAALRQYLGSDEALFQWVCALCIYPKLRPELVVAFGRAVLGRYGREADLRYDVLLLLARIPWMATGSLPQRLRADLLQTLEVPNELAARAALLHLLKDVDRRYPGDYIFSGEKRLQSLMSRFVLYAADSEHYKEHERAVTEMAQRLAEGNITDVPARKYLERAAGGAYDTPLQLAGSTVSMQQFIHARDAAERAKDAAAEQAARMRRVKKVTTAFGIIGGLGVLWSLLCFHPAARRIPQLAGLYSVDSGQTVQLRYRVAFKNPDDCGDSASRSKLELILAVDDHTYRLTDAGNSMVTASLPYAQFAGPGASYSFTLRNGSSVTELMADTLSTGGSIEVSCRQHVSDTTEKTAEVTLPDNYNEIWYAPANNRLISINLSKRMIYYSTGDPKTYGSYRIDTVIMADNRFKVLTQAYPGYNVFFIADYQPGQISVGICPDRYSDLKAALAARTSCAVFYAMAPYYERISNKIFLPVAPRGGGSPPLQASEVKKMLDFIYKAEDAAVFRIGYQLFRNSGFISSYSDYDLKAQVKARYPNLNTTLTKLRSMEVPNPFQRENLELEDISPRGAAAQPMSEEQICDSIANGLDQKTIRITPAMYRRLMASAKGSNRAQGTYEYAKYLVAHGNAAQAEKILDALGKLNIMPLYYDLMDLVRSDALKQQGDVTGAEKILQRLKENSNQDVRQMAGEKLEALKNPGYNEPKR